MTLISQIFVYGAVGFLIGYILGRIGHCHINVWLKNPRWLPHHWIYGAALIPVSSYFTESMLGLILLFFGVGHFISDLKDFIELKFFVPDQEGKKRFFHID